VLAFPLVLSLHEELAPRLVGGVHGQLADLFYLSAFTFTQRPPSMC
jgi:hypothetical protein